jgi:hypothetical protein
MKRMHSCHKFSIFHCFERTGQFLEWIEKDSRRGKALGLDLTGQWAASFKIVKQEKVWIERMHSCHKFSIYHCFLFMINIISNWECKEGQSGLPTFLGNTIRKSINRIVSCQCVCMGRGRRGPDSFWNGLKRTVGGGKL